MISSTKTKIGLEVHSVITAAKHKAFSKALNCNDDYPPNTCVDKLDIALPGALPVLNPEIILYGIRACLALNMIINEEFAFDRKLYFFEDLPLGYQLTQFFKPIGINGRLTCDAFDVNIRQLHLEIDASKIIREDNKIFLDHNRSGCPLMEIVTEPDFANADQVISFLKMLRSTLKYTRVSDCKMELGHFRVDVNISINGGNRVEIKNLNSDDAIRKAIAYEELRQSQAEQSGMPVACETRSFDGQKTIYLRRKESADDYMYFNEPDLPPFRVDPEIIQQQRQNLHKLPINLYSEWQKTLDLKQDELESLISDPMVIRFLLLAFDGQDVTSKKIIIKLILGEIFAMLNKNEDHTILIDPKNLQKLAQYIKSYKPNSMIIKQILDQMWITNEDPNTISERLNLSPITDEIKINQYIDEVIQNSPNELSKYLSGKSNLIGFFVGQVMTKTNNRVPGNILNKLLMQKLNSYSKQQ